MMSRKDADMFNKAFMGPLFIAVYADAYIPYEEAPGESDDPYAENEYTVRVFTTKEEAISYIMAIESYNDADFSVLEIPWDLLIGFVLKNCEVAEDTGIRIVLSKVEPSEWPKTIDTIWSSNAVLN